MNTVSFEFNKHLELDVLVNGLTEVTEDYVINYTSLYAIDEIVIPHGITHIKDEAFCYCNGLIAVTLPDTVTYIGDEAFIYCEDLKVINIPVSVTSIGSWAFYGCS